MIEDILNILNLKTFKPDVFPIKFIFFINLFNKEMMSGNDNHSPSSNSGNIALAEDIYKDYSCLLFFLLVQYERLLS